MNQRLPLCLLVTLALAGCAKDPKKKDDEKAVKQPAPSASTATGAATADGTQDTAKAKKPGPPKGPGGGPGGQQGAGGPPPGGEIPIPDFQYDDADVQAAFDAVTASLKELQGKLAAICPDAATRETCAESHADELMPINEAMHALGTTCFGEPPAQGQDGGKPSDEQLAQIKEQIGTNVVADACKAKIAGEE